MVLHHSAEIIQNMFCSNMFDIRTRLIPQWSGVGSIFSPDLAQNVPLEMCYANFETIGNYPKRNWATCAIRIALL